ncbi:MAG TPA: D-alanyl-D-alanine carboxypeptidase, partial [Rhodobacteraceae bacterium]|nr:D-alanyl-D-alanine carboxypeptidase [Paracoccaceae bacterium]
KIRKVNNTNRRFLAAYKGADGIKTGYTRAAGFNLVASAERGGKRIVATMFGGSSTAARNKRVAQLLDMGFERAPATAKLQRPSLPPYDQNENETGGKTLRLVTAVKRSLRPKMRPFGKASGPEEVLLADLPEVLVQPDDILTAVQSATSGAVAVQVSASTFDPEMPVTAPRARPP